jgi:adhesin/invasin
VCSVQGPLHSRLRPTILTGLLTVAVLLRLTACADVPDPAGPEGPRAGQRQPVASVAAATSQTAVLVGAADVTHCGPNLGDEKTAAVINGLIANDPSITVYVGGDDAYDVGSASNFTNCYDPSWGQFKARTRPALGDHDYGTGTANPYFDYFNSFAGQAGERGKGYYSYDLGQWHVVVLNSNVNFLGTKAGTPQELWLQDDLAATSQPCILAYWHAPRFRSSTTSPLPAPKPYVRDFWVDLYAERADIVLNGDQHFYERFAKQDPDGAADAQGIREFVVGTGGKSVSNPTVIAPNSEMHDGTGFGVLKLTLGDGTYDYQFLPVAGATFTESGSGTCNPKTPLGTMTVKGGNNQSATVATAVAPRPSVKLTDGNGVPLANVAVTFSVSSGGGSGTGLAKTTTAGGIATVGSWTLGTVAGPNTMTARAKGFTGSPLVFTATATPGPANAAQSTATVPNGTAGSPTPIAVQAKDQYGNNRTTGGSVVVVTVSGTNSASPAVTDNGNGTYSASYTPAAAGSDQVAITLGGTAISGSPYTSTVAAAGTATTIALNAGNDQSTIVNTAVHIAPSVKVTDASNQPVEGVAVTFAVTLGGGSVTGNAAPTTDGNGIATVGGWTLGTVAGSSNNTLTATSAGLSGSPVTFTASATPGSADAGHSTATVPNGTVGSPTTIAVQAKDQYSNNLTTGGATVVVTVSGANSASPTVTDNANGTYSASYTPSAAGTDQVAITLSGTAISGSPYTSTVAGGTPTTMTLNAGNNQSATVNTAVSTAPSVLVTDASSQPVAGVAVTFAVTLGGGSITGASQTTNALGIATVGSWTLGTKSGTNKLTATSAGLTGSPVTFTATGTAGAPTAIAISAGDGQTASAGTAVTIRPAVNVTDAFNNVVPGVAVTFAVASGGGSVTGASKTTGSGGVATVGSWTLGPAPGSNTLRATASPTGISGNPVTFTATGT